METKRAHTGRSRDRSKRVRGLRKDKGPVAPRSKGREASLARVAWLRGHYGPLGAERNHGLENIRRNARYVLASIISILAGLHRARIRGRNIYITRCAFGPEPWAIRSKPDARGRDLTFLGSLPGSEQILWYVDTIDTEGGRE